MTRSEWTTGLILRGSPPSLATASRMAARSTTTGTPVKSCSATRPGMYGNSVAGDFSCVQDATSATSSSDAGPRCALRRAFSSRMRIENGRAEMLHWPASSSAPMSKNRVPDRPGSVRSVSSVVAVIVLNRTRPRQCEGGWDEMIVFRVSLKTARLCPRRR